MNISEIKEKKSNKVVKKIFQDLAKEINLEIKDILIDLKEIKNSKKIKT